MIGHHVCRFIFVLMLLFVPAAFAAAEKAAETPGAKPVAEEKEAMTPPFEGPLKYPFTKKGSIDCGHWGPGSQDYPYFGAPRGGSTRNHAGVDLYPVKGAGTPVTAVLGGTVIKIAPFYTRRNGEVTYAVLVDHGDFVANYAELKKPAVAPGARVKRGQVIGIVSGTNQLHFELYSPGTQNWLSWRGETMPPNLRDPTAMMIGLYTINGAPD